SGATTSPGTDNRAGRAPHLGTRTAATAPPRAGRPTARGTPGRARTASTAGTSPAGADGRLRRGGSCRHRGREGYQGATAALAEDVKNDRQRATTHRGRGARVGATAPGVHGADGQLPVARDAPQCDLGGPARAQRHRRVAPAG